MNILLWALQVLLALHTLAGAFWKFSNSEQAVPSLSAMPHWGWMALSLLEILAAVGLLLPALKKSLSIYTPVAAGFIALEMLLFCVLHVISGDQNYGQIMYWLVVTALCAFIVYGRSVLKPF